MVPTDRHTHHPQHDSFGALLRAVRQRAGLSQERLAIRAGLSARTIRYLERSQVNPRPDTAQRLADALGLDEPAQAQFSAAASPVPAAAGRALPPVAAVPAQLPADVAGFTGRAEYLAQLDALLAGADDRARAVAITAIGGTAGVGKTALAVHWAHQVADRFGDGQLYVNLHGFAPIAPLSPLQALAQLLGALGVDADKIPVEVDQAAGLYRSLLAGRRVLVVADNARNADQVRPLLPGSPGCVVVVTSRERLAGLVASHGAQRLTLDVLAPEEAVSLLAGIVGTDRVQAESQAAAALARACAFLPLALRIAAANLSCHPNWSIGGYLERLRAGDRLVELAIDGDPHAAIGVAFDCSYATLDADTQRLFRLLGLIPGPEITPEAAAALAGLPVERAARLLERLAAAHLLEPRGSARFGFHDLLRAYARQRTEHDDATQACQQALEQFLGWYVRTADRASELLYPQRLRLPIRAAQPTIAAGEFNGRGEALAWLDAERACVVAAVQHAAEHGPRPVAWLLADALRVYFFERRHMVDWLAVADAALRAADAEADPHARAAARRGLGMARQCLGDYTQAAEHFTSAVAFARQADWVDGEAAAVTDLSIVHSFAGQLQQAADCGVRALVLFRQTGFAGGQGIILGNLAEIELQLGQPEQAIGHLIQALAVWREIDAKGPQVPTLGNLGDAYRELGRLEEAAEHRTQALALARAVGNRYIEANSLQALAAVHRDAGRLQLALQRAETAVALADQIGDPRVAADTLSTLGSVKLGLGDGQRAAEHYWQALHLARQATARHPETEALLGLAATCQHQGHYAQALEHAEQAHSLARKGSFRILEGRARATLAAIHLDRDHDGEAAGHAEQALAIHHETGHRLGQARALVILGHTRHRARDNDGARSCWGEALALLADIGSPDSAQVQALLDEVVGSS